MLKLGVGQSAQGNGREEMVPEFPCPGSKYTLTSYQKKGVLNHSFSLAQGGMALSVLLPQAPECRVTWVSDQPLCGYVLQGAGSVFSGASIEAGP